MASKNRTISALDFTGRRLLVTGGASGIGKAIAIKFLELNATVIVIDKDVSMLEKLAREYPKILTIKVDLRNWDETRKVVESVLPIHHLANNAGNGLQRNFLDIDLEFIDAVFDVNFKAALNVAQVVAKGMIANNIRNGTIVNIGSISDEIASKMLSMYAASKAALTMLTKCMAVELAKYGIRVNCVAPAAVNTEQYANLPDEYKEKHLAPWLDRLLFHKLIEPESVAESVVFLSSRMSSNITGTKLLIDQGSCVQ